MNKNESLLFDELIQIPEFLGIALSSTMTPFCSICEIACETDAMWCAQCSRQSCGGQCTASQCSQGCAQCSGQSGCGSQCNQGCGSCEGGCQSSCESAVQAPSGTGTITSISATSTTIRITYTSISGASGYEIAWRRSGETGATTIRTSSLSYTITGLTPDTEYVVNYRGYNSGGDGSYMSSGRTISTSLIQWSWTASNGSASSAQTQSAYTAVMNKGRLSSFNYLVWNDLVNMINLAINTAGGSWNSSYASLANTLMTSGNKNMTAVRFNSARYNLGRYISVGLGEVSRGNKIYGSYFTSLTIELNRLLNSL